MRRMLASLLFPAADRSCWTSVMIISMSLLQAPIAKADPISRTYADIQAYLADVVRQYPANAQLFDLGMSDSGKMIQGVKIGNGPVKNLVVATHHGNEYGSTEIAKGFAKATAADPIRGQTIFVIPVLNIGGYDRRQRQEAAGGRSFDPNRNYPGPCGTEGPLTLKSTKSLAAFVEREGIVTSATLHTFASMVLYPWGLSARGNDLKTPYDDFFIQLGKASALESGYQVGNSTELLYPADGTYEDYAFWKHGIWSLLFEAGSSHSPSQSSVDQMVTQNVPGLRRMMTEAPTTRAEKHDFTGRCDVRLKSLDRHDE
jgi:carboxypeptidase T